MLRSVSSFSNLKVLYLEDPYLKTMSKAVKTMGSVYPFLFIHDMSIFLVVASTPASRQQSVTDRGTSLNFSLVIGIHH